MGYVSLVDTLMAKFAQKTQVKSAEAMRAGSRDNRTPFVGGTQFPTEGSKGLSRKLDQQSKAVAEQGPAPTYGGMQTVKYEVPKMKIGQTSDVVADDPLIRFLREDPDFQKQAEQLDTNIDQLLVQSSPKPIADESPNFSETVERKKREEEALLKELFTHYPSESPSIG